MTNIDLIGVWACLVAFLWRLPQLLSVWLSWHVDRLERESQRRQRARESACLAPASAEARILSMEEPEWQRPS